MAIVNHSITLDGSTDITDVQGNTLSWMTAYLPFLGLWENNISDNTTVDIGVTGSNWTMTTIRCASSLDMFTLTDYDAGSGRLIEYIGLGQNSQIDLTSTRVRHIYASGGNEHWVMLGTATTETVELFGTKNTVTTGDGFVKYIGTDGRSIITVNQGGAGTVALGSGNDVVRVQNGGFVGTMDTQNGDDRVVMDNGSVSVLGMGDGTDELIMIGASNVRSLLATQGDTTISVRQGSEIGSLELGTGTHTIEMIGASFIDRIKIYDSTNTITSGTKWISSIITGNSQSTITIGSGGAGTIHFQGSPTDTGTNTVNAVGRVGAVLADGGLTTHVTTGNTGGAGIIRLADGADTVTTGSGFVEVISTNGGDDTVTANGSVGVVRLGDGNDTITTGSAWIEFISASNGNDTATIGSGGAGTVGMGSGNDTVITGTGWVELITTNDGHDDVTLGSAGASQIRLGSGDDMLHVTEMDPNSGVIVFGSSGSDTIDFQAYTSTGIVLSLSESGWQNPGAPGGDTALTGTGYMILNRIENVIATNLDDLINGNDDANHIIAGHGRDTVYGHGGDDVILGGNHRDVFIGGAGNDTLIGGRGNDLLVGQGGADTFVFQAAGGTDKVQSYQHGIDRLEIHDHVGGFASLIISDQGADLKVVYDGGAFLLVGDAGMVLTAADFDFI